MKVKSNTDAIAQKKRWKMLLFQPAESLQQMVDDNEDVNVECHFCDKNYKFTPSELRNCWSKQPNKKFKKVSKKSIDFSIDL